jgi:epoxyqueuosine reductase
MLKHHQPEDSPEGLQRGSPAQVAAQIPAHMTAETPAEFAAAVGAKLGTQTPLQLAATATQLRLWARELGFSQIGITGIDLTTAEPGLLQWLAAGFHGSMGYMARHGLKRARPAELVPGTVRVVSARMDYRPRDSAASGQAFVSAERAALHTEGQAVVSVYARGRDYHKVMRQRLQQLAERLAQTAGPLGYRVFSDSAPVLEVELATRAGLAWRGKHTLALSRDAGSFFFLGEIFIDMPLPVDEPTTDHCGTCSACISACPTGAIVAPYRLDARRCISYLTIEHDGAIDEALRPLLGNRIYGCDDCQLVCPWNRWSQRSSLPDFDTRVALQAPGLLQLWAWSEAEFLHHTEGSAIRRIGYIRWRRNLAVALGNGLRETAMADTVRELRLALAGAPEWLQPDSHALVAEHIGWALAQRA